MFRSFFQFDTTTFEGAKVHRAQFVLTPNHRNSCAPVTLEAWHTRPIDPAVPLTWHNSREHRLGGAPVDTRVWPRCDEPVMRVEFESPALLELVRRAAAERTGFMSLGLRVRNERNRTQGMRFTPEVFLIVDDNNPPDAPQVYTNPPTPCGTAGAPTPVGAGASTNYTAFVRDPDSDNITTRLEILGADSTPVHTSDVGPTASGAAFAWPEVPAGVLRHGDTYRYRAVSSDSLDAGPASPDCYFTIDTVRPGVPRIASTDYPDGEPVILARTTGTVTLRPATADIADTDVVEFLFGFQQDKITGRIRVGTDGSAVLPITVAEDPITGVPSERLYVRAVDAAGNTSPATPVWVLAAIENPAPQARERGDTSGDGRADVAVMLDHSFGRAMVWNVTARADGFHSGFVGFDVGAGSYASRVRYVRGDFDGNGRTDIATLYHHSDGGATLGLLSSDGNRYDATNVWHSETEPWPFDSTRILSGDVDGDGKADVAAQGGVPGGGWEVRVFRGGALNAPATWYRSGAQEDGTRARLVAGDVDGDGRADLMELRDQGDCRASLLVYRSTGTSFAAGEPVWDSRPAGFCTERATPVAGDVDGDGRDDLVVRYDHGGGDAALVVFTPASGFTPQVWWRQTSVLAGPAVLGTGDFDLDGVDDLAVVRADCTTGETRLWTSRSTGTAFDDPVLGWQENTGGTAMLAPSRTGG